MHWLQNFFAVQFKFDFKAKNSGRFCCNDWSSGMFANVLVVTFPVRKRDGLCDPSSMLLCPSQGFSRIIQTLYSCCIDCHGLESRSASYGSWKQPVNAVPWLCLLLLVSCLRFLSFPVLISVCSDSSIRSLEPFVRVRPNGRWKCVSSMPSSCINSKGFLVGGVLFCFEWFVLLGMLLYCSVSDRK